MMSSAGNQDASRSKSERADAGFLSLRARGCRMNLKITTWNINSVRLRIELVANFIATMQPDILCLQETKCPDDAFPTKRFKQLGYDHIALNGQKGYHGVAVISRLPFDHTTIRTFCDNLDSRHISVTLGATAGLAEPLVVHNFYVPAGGDIPDLALNPKFVHKLAFLDEMADCDELHARGSAHHILVGDLNVAPHEHDVWSHKQMLKVVSHTPIECEKLLAVKSRGNWIDIARHRIAEPEKIFTWWSYRAADWAAANRGRRLDHIWASSALENRISDFSITRDARGWERPSDHVPVTATLAL
jgi:exodeoxyribonuclease-3